MQTLVLIHKPVIDLLAERRQEQKRYRTGDTWASIEGCVFIQVNGSRMSISTLYSRFQKLVKKYNATVSEDMQLPVLSLYCLRHANASLLVRSNKVDIASVSKKLGHADPNVTAEYYLHSYEEGEQETADILGDMLLDSGAKVTQFVFTLNPL